MNTEFVTIPISDKIMQVFQGDARYRGAYGGRASSKSYSFAAMALVKALEKPLNILCAREFQNSIRDSVLSQLKMVIDDYPILQRYYKVGETYIRGANGSEFIFKGLRNNYNSLKSLSNIDICWVEEAETISENSWLTLIPTIRKPGSEIWLTWNPESPDSPTNIRFRKFKDSINDAKIVEVNWSDNPWFNETIERERQNDLRNRPDIYGHIWEGEYLTRSDAQVIADKFTVEDFLPESKIWDGPYYGCDWGFAVDPTAVIKFWIDSHNKKLYIERENVGYGVEITDTPAFIRSVAGNGMVYADNARPELISHCQKNGINIQAAKKWHGSVEDGISWLRSFNNIVIHSSCQETYNEARRWSYKVDRLTNDVKPELMKGNDHCFDAIRYGASKMIRGGSTDHGVLDFGSDLTQSNPWL